MISLIFLVLSLPSIQAVRQSKVIENQHDRLWGSYKQTYGLLFENEEDAHRQSVFLKNVQFIDKFNSENSHMELRVNNFAHLTDKEFAEKYLSSAKIATPQYVKGRKVNKTVDWRTKGVVNRIKNQGMCGSCWAFSAIGALESQYAIKKGRLYILSEQQLVDCSGKYGNNGCDGGLMDSAFRYIRDKGISSNRTYPYTARDQICKKAPRTPVAVADFEDVDSGSENFLTHMIMYHGPVSVAIDASSSKFRFYHSGIYYDKNCSSESLDHGVVAVGVSDKYYIVRNSWSTEWGDKGYIKMSRNRKNNCGIASAASYPIIKD